MAQPKGCIPVNKGNATSFIEKAKKIHGDKYDYSKVNYINSGTHITIICNLHGEFSQTPSMHVSGQQCPKCSIAQRSKKRAMSKNEFIQRSIKLHGDKYIYDKVVYTNNRTKVDIYCTSCTNRFLQNPDDHLQGHGCPHCSSNVVDITKPVYFYILELEHTNPVYKFGITGRSIKHRYKCDNPNKVIKNVLLEIAFLDGYDAILLEKFCKNKFKEQLFKEDKMFFDKTKNTEIITVNPFNHVQDYLRGFQLKE